MRVSATKARIYITRLGILAGVQKWLIVTIKGKPLVITLDEVEKDDVQLEPSSLKHDDPNIDPTNKGDTHEKMEKITRKLESFFKIPNFMIC